MNSMGGGDDKEDQETSLTADGLMTAIRRVLMSISGKYKELYPQLEEILERPLELTLTEIGQSSVEEGLTCISELLYNQEQISMRMWKFYQMIINLILNDTGILDGFLPQASVPLINFMSKNPDQFRTANFEGQGTCLDMIFSLVAKIFNNSREKEDEIEAMCAITLVISLLENITGIESSLPNIIEFFVKELGQAKTPEYKCMLSQGICMALWYSTDVTLQSLEAMNSTEQALELMFAQVQSLKQDFELKRFCIGFTQLISRDPTTLPVSVGKNQATIMKVLVFIANQSVFLREKNMRKEKDEEAEEAQVEQAIYDEDEDAEDIADCDDEDDEDDEDYDCNEFSGRELYDSKLDSIDEVLFFRDTLVTLQSNMPQLYDFLLSTLDSNEQATLNGAINKAIEFSAQ